MRKTKGGIKFGLGANSESIIRRRLEFAGSLMDAQGGFKKKRHCRSRRKEAHFEENQSNRASLRRLLRILESALMDLPSAIFYLPSAVLSPLCLPHDYRTVVAGREFRKTGRRGHSRGQSRRPVAAPGHHGRTLCAQYLLRSGGCPRAAPTDSDVSGRAFDVFAPGDFARPLRQG